jgi:pimeloyl-ACP methyl ester carboxylesterase
MAGGGDAIESAWIVVHGRRIHARVTAPTSDVRPPLVLVHGLGVSSRYFVRVARALAPHFRIHAPDLPGFGRSEGTPASLSVPDLARELLAFLDASGLDRPLLFGNSMGCQVLLALAVAAPERVRGLVLVGPTVDPAWRSFRRQIGRWLLEATREPWSIFPILAVDYLRCGPRRFFGTARYALADRPEDELPRVRAKALVVRGERDAFVSPAWAARMTALLPNATFVTIAGAPHAAHYVAPERLARLVVSTFASDDRTR